MQRKDGLPVDSFGEFPDGTQFNGVLDLKAYLVENIDIFSRCITQKMMIYATGRLMNHGDQRVIDGIVAQTRAAGNGFEDLLLALVQSESFRTK